MTLPFVFVLNCLPAPAETVTLAWDRNPEIAVTGYRLYYGTSPGVYSAAVDAGNQTQVIINGLLTAKTYFAAVAAYTSTGIESLKSESISFVTEGTSTYPEPSPPDPEPPAPEPEPEPEPEPDLPSPPVTDSTPPAPVPPTEDPDPVDPIEYALFLAEAESGETVRPMAPAGDDEASGGEYVRTSGGGKNGSQGSLTLSIKAPERGDYFVWGLVKIHPRREGALYLAQDGGPPVYFAGDQSPGVEGGEWEWVCLRDSRKNESALHLTGKNQILDFYPMGFAPSIDCLVFTTDPYFHPDDHGL